MPVYELASRVTADLLARKLHFRSINEKTRFRSSVSLGRSAWDRVVLNANLATTQIGARG